MIVRGRQPACTLVRHCIPVKSQWLRLQDEPVAEHEDPFVRKSALVATAELLRALPAARLAGAMVRSHSRGAPADDSAFAARLTQLQEHLRVTHASSPDTTLRCDVKMY